MSPATDEGVRTTAEAFVDRVGHSPEGVWSAPGRVNLVGEHTDYNDGLVLPIALPQRTWAACSRRDDDIVRVHSMSLDETVEVALGDVSAGSPTGWVDYVAGVLWALREEGHGIGGLDVVVDSSVPVGAGLSSSAALECAVGAAASDLFTLDLLATDDARRALVAACMRAENDIAGAATGGMDQSAALLARAGHALFLDCRTWGVEHIPFDLAGHGLTLLVTDTRAAHTLADGQYETRRRASERAARALAVPSLRDVDPADLQRALDTLVDPELAARARHVVTEIDRVRATVMALRADDFGAVGAVFDESHRSLRDDYEVSCPELDVAVEAARAAGAMGARMTGGGFGGSSIALVPTDRVGAAGAHIAEEFDRHGWRAPVSFAVTAEAAAHRDR